MWIRKRPPIRIEPGAFVLRILPWPSLHDWDVLRARPSDPNFEGTYGEISEFSDLLGRTGITGANHSSCKMREVLDDDQPRLRRSDACFALSGTLACLTMISWISCGSDHFDCSAD